MKIRLNTAENRLEVYFAGRVDQPGAFFTAERSFHFPAEPEAFGRQARVAMDGDGYVREVVVTGLASIVTEMLGPKAAAHVNRGAKPGAKP
jgi:hypothetical protein